MDFKKYKIVFLTAMGYEIKNIFEPLGFAKIDGGFPYEIWANGDYLVIDTGVSKTYAAAGTQWGIDVLEAERWVNVGLCGSLKDSFDYGEVVGISECRFHDVDNRGLNPNWKIGQIPGDDEYIYKLLPLTENMRMARMISGDQFVTDKSKLEEIVQEFDPDLVDEELTAIACVMNKNKQLEKLSALKIVSDKADEKAAEDFDKEERLFSEIRKILSAIMTD